VSTIVAGRALSALAALALLAVVVLSVVPAHATTLDDRARRVSCGTFLFPSDYRYDDACEDATVSRLVASMFLWLAAQPVGATGLVLLSRAARYD
jgi:hypothetical protein